MTRLALDLLHELMGPAVWGPGVGFHTLVNWCFAVLVSCFRWLEFYMGAAAVPSRQIHGEIDDIFKSGRAFSVYLSEKLLDRCSAPRSPLTTWSLCKIGPLGDPPAPYHQRGPCQLARG